MLMLQGYIARTLAEQEWEKLQQAHVLANVQQAFDVSSDAEIDGDNESLLSCAGDVISPTGHTDAQTLALMLQEQLDAINNEIRLIQVRLNYFILFFIFKERQYFIWNHNMQKCVCLSIERVFLFTESSFKLMGISCSSL